MRQNFTEIWRADWKDGWGFTWKNYLIEAKSDVCKVVFHRHQDSDNFKNILKQGENNCFST